MEAETKFERREVLLVWQGDRSNAVPRLFSHMDGERFACAREEYSLLFLAGEEVHTASWTHAERIPKPSPFRKGELVVTTKCADELEYIAFSCGRNTATNRLTEQLESECHAVRRPTIEELQKWLPWCEIKPKQGENQ
jgi:hypothetical protein